MIPVFFIRYISGRSRSYWGEKRTDDGNVLMAAGSSVS